MLSGWRACVLALALLIGSAATPALAEESATAPATAFVGVAIVPMDRERIVENQTVLVRGGLIERVGPASRVSVPRGYRRINGRGQYLLPGLADFHVHLRSPGEFASYLAHGVTTIAQLSGTYATPPDILGYKRLVRSGALIGPNIYASGPLVDNTPLLPHIRTIGVGVATAEEARALAAAQKAAGYDMVKIYQMLTPENYDALVTASLEQGIAPVGHVPQTIELSHALRSGQVMIAHGGFFMEPLLNVDGSTYDVSRLPTLLELAVRNRVAVIPTIMTEVGRQRLLDSDTYHAVFADAEANYLPPSLYEIWRRTDPSLLRRFGRPPELTVPFHLHLIKALQDAGVLILMGTDEGALPGLFPGRSVHDELAMFVEAGLTPYQALATATRNAGEFARLRIEPGESFGILASGHRADLLLLDANPLEDVRNAANPNGVMVRGRWLTRSDLLALREATKREFELGPPTALSQLPEQPESRP